MLRIALVSYFNTRPFMDGLQASFSPDELDLQTLAPVDCAEALISAKCDMALIPVGALTDFEGIHVMKDYCIGADGAVNSVFLLSQCPIEEAESLILDPHSRTSNSLAMMLLRDYWHRNLPVQRPQKRDFSRIEGKVAGVAIGDQAYQIRNQYAYVYDLSATWKKWTGLSFVFAVWAYEGSKWSAKDLLRVREALQSGIGQKAVSAKKWGEEYGYSPEAAEQYLCSSICYEMNASRHAALHKYFETLKELPLFEDQLAPAKR